MAAALPAAHAEAGTRAGARVAPATRAHAAPAHAPLRAARPARHDLRARTRLPRSARTLRAAKRRAARSYRRDREAAPPRAARRPIVSGGLSWQGVSASASTPPDTTGAIGLDHYVEATNDGVVAYTRATAAEVDAVPLDAFLGVPGSFVTDPQIIWDAGTGRWYYAGIGVDSGDEQLLFGFSKTADPSDLDAGWCRYSIATTGFIDDFPKLGDDDAHIVIGANRFQSDETFDTAVIYAIDKPAAGATCPAPPAFTRFGSSADPLEQTGGATTFTPVPANTADASDAGYVVSADAPGGGGGTHVEAWHVGGPAGSPTLTRDGAIPVTPFGVPANAPQAGTADLLDTSDTRLTQAVAHVDPATGAEAVWTQHTVSGFGGRAVVRWYELIPAQLSARQTGTVDEGSNFAFNAAISPTLDGSSAVIDYNVSGPAALPRIAARSRRPDAPLGQMSPAVTLAASAGPLGDGSCSPGPCRWGDYAGAAPDPVNSALVWGSSEYVESGDWTSRNFAIDVGGPGPVAGFEPSPGTVDSGQSIAFDASSTAGRYGVGVTRYEWDLDGDGGFETDTGGDPHASRPYASPGVVTARLRVTDAAGDQSTAERTVTIRNRAPVASFNSSAATTPVGRGVFLDGSTSFDPDGRVVRYQWDLDGDGTFETDTGQSATTPTAAFANPAIVTLRLRVTDDLGATGEAARAVTVVRPAPPPPSAGCLAARASVKRLTASVRKLKRQTKRAHGARKRRLVRKLRVERRRLANARVRVNTLC